MYQFCIRLFAKDAATKDLFKNVNVDDLSSPEFRAHCVRVTNGLDTVINMAFDNDVLEEQLKHLANQHTKYEGMKADYLRVRNFKWNLFKFAVNFEIEMDTKK